MKKIYLFTFITIYRIYFRLLFLLMPRLAAKKAMILFSTPLNKKVRTRELEILAQAEKTTMSYDGLKIRVYAWGDSPHTALLVHGWEGNGGSLGAFVRPLLDSGYSVLAFDGPAHGQSTGKQTNVFHFSALVAKLIKENNVKLLISHSFGSAASIFALSTLGNYAIDKMVIMTTPDKMEDVISGFVDFMKINAKGKHHIFRYLHEQFGRRIEDMTISDIASQVSPPKLMIVHSQSDKILPFQGALQVAAKVPYAILEAPLNAGHYKILWDAQVIDKVKTFIHE